MIQPPCCRAARSARRVSRWASLFVAAYGVTTATDRANIIVSVLTP
jgi:hypothetical protein